VRGFVTSYVRFINLDPKEVLTRFGSFIDSKAHDRPNRDAGHSGYAFERREGEQSRTLLWVVMGSFVVLGGVAAVFVKKPMNRHHHSQADKLRAAHTEVVATASPSASPIGAAVAVAPSPVAPFIGPENRSTSTAIAEKPAPIATTIVAVAAAPSPSPVTVAETRPKEPTPQTSPTTAQVASSETTEEAPNPEDPLNSGLKLKTSEIKHKVVFKAQESAWVRYKVDHKPVTQFVFRNGKVLVLRAKESIRFQVSPPKALTFSYGGRGFKPVLGDEHLQTRQNDATLFFPYEVADSIEEPFPNEKALSKRAVPAPRPSPALSTPSP
jgi:cytoskeletal protein RodZ